MKKLTLLTLISFVAVSNFAIAQQDNRRVITTGVPFLLVSGDARASGMGDMGVATPVDAFSQQWNPAKYAFAKSKQGVGVSYVPYLRQLVTDINLGVLTYYNRLNERSAVAGSIRYFGQGEIELRQTPDEAPQIVKPNEFGLDLTYALRLSEHFSMAVGGRFISSNLKIPDVNGDASAANTFGVDISAFYQSEEIFYNDFNGRWRGGINISNIGPKLKYDDGGDDSYLPTNFKAGVGFDFILDASNTIGVYTEFNKLLVPTPPKLEYDENNQLTEGSQNDLYKYHNKSPIGAVFSSWGDAPDGFKEELKEFTWAIGAEYWYEDSFAFRAGYFSEAEDKGFRKFATIGAGFKYSMINIDASYLFSTSKINNPLEGSLRFSLTFNFGDEYVEY
ncbi:hypothetical protein GGR32_001761 [Mesonia hippocampi]|uniref:Type IX secretion system protein PorV domain-containing protein n=1 Tax=Mesonia hippocampi TaxID=1628250 RepID=A0A840ESE7_9FLAO|nr:type IX secretion system outer membrane channel protein PorV [Mesonia hippocampi]MBB4119463.1 hypothetical protein [Mesonia hippocampi]